MFISSDSISFIRAEKCKSNRLKRAETFCAQSYCVLTSATCEPSMNIWSVVSEDGALEYWPDLKGIFGLQILHLSPIVPFVLPCRKKSSVSLRLECSVNPRSFSSTTICQGGHIKLLKSLLHEILGASPCRVRSTERESLEAEACPQYHRLIWRRLGRVEGALKLRVQRLQASRHDL